MRVIMQDSLEEQTVWSGLQTYCQKKNPNWMDLIQTTTGTTWYITTWSYCLDLKIDVFLTKFYDRKLCFSWLCLIWCCVIQPASSSTHIDSTTGSETLLCSLWYYVSLFEDFFNVWPEHFWEKQLLEFDTQLQKLTVFWRINEEDWYVSGYIISSKAEYWELMKHRGPRRALTFCNRYNFKTYCNFSWKATLHVTDR